MNRTVQILTEQCPMRSKTVLTSRKKRRRREGSPRCPSRRRPKNRDLGACFDQLRAAWQRAQHGRNSRRTADQPGSEPARARIEARG